jgi:prolipoprotein diacylglyceryl transferase
VSVGLFVSTLGLVLVILLTIAYKVLPREQWQILAALPRSKTAEGNWNGLNLTYYGLFVASAEVFAAMTITVLITSTGMHVTAGIAVITIVLGVCVPSARWIARAVDRRKYNFTVSGAVAVGLITVPLATALVGWIGHPVSMAVVFAASAVGYTLGEGIGRVACVSFGCCYGKPLNETSPRLRKFFSRFHFIFTGATKKIAYESGLDGVPVIPIQAVTSFAHIAAGLFAMLAFLKGFIIAAFIISSVMSYGWRIYSETLRADHRGEGRISKYQIMSAVGILYTIIVAALLREPDVQPDLSNGLHALWNPVVIVFYQLSWLGLFIYHGRSMVTSSEISIRLERDRL